MNLFKRYRVAIAIGLAAVIALLIPLLGGIGTMLLIVVLGTNSGPAPNQACYAAGNFGSVSGSLRTPMSGPYEVGSGFGPRFHPIYHEWRNHNGVDLTLKGGEGPIVAAMSGTVTRAGLYGDAGNEVILSHDGGVETLYMHLSSIAVTVGQSVTPGQPLGIEGSTGASTAPHLHWAVRVNGQYVDPVAWAASHGLAVDGTVAGNGDGASSPGIVPLGGATAAPTGTTGSVAGYSPAQVAIAAQIVAAGKAMGLDTWTLTGGVMTGMGESTLRNITYGDASGPDSRGVFQQRANGAWGSLEDRMNPAIAATNFFKALIAVPDYHSLEATIAAHKTQGNADPYHYRQYWQPATLVVSAVLSDPTIANLAAVGGCTTLTNAGTVPALPTDCPPSGSPAEAKLQQHALNFLRCTHVAFPAVTTFYGWRASDPYPDHPSGAAVDVMIPGDYRSPAGVATGDQVVAWVQANKDTLAVKYLIWRQRQWTPARGWTAMADRGSDTANHYDHVHVTLSDPLK